MARLADPEFLQNLMNMDIPVPISPGRVRELEAEALDALWGDMMSEAACAVCDVLVVLAKLTELALHDDEPLVKKMPVRLKAPEDLRGNAQLLEQYRVDAPGVRRSGDMLLSPRGVSRPANPSEGVFSTHIRICASCRNSLQRGTVEDTNPPKFAIANHVAIGLMSEEFANSTPVVVKLYICCIICVVFVYYLCSTVCARGESLGVHSLLHIKNKKSSGQNLGYRANASTVTRC